jgi:phage antirepressor YoqD-like protein
MASTTQLPAALTVAGIHVRQDAAGRFCLNDLHRASGGHDKDKPNRFLRLDSTRELIEALRTEEQKRASEQINDLEPIVTVNSFTAEQGTFVVRELVYHYAMWISPAFNLRVIRAYDALVTAPPRTDPTKLTRLDLIQLAMDAEQERLALELQVHELEPKAAALERIADATGSMCITLAAKTLQIQPKQLFGWLKQHCWIYRRTGSAAWTAYQDKLQADLLEHKVTTISRAEGPDKVATQVLVTPRGLARIAERLQPGAHA